MQIAARVALVEPVAIDDDICSALALIERVGPNARFVYYVKSTCYETGEVQFVVRRKIVLPIEAIAGNRLVVSAFMDDQIMSVAG